MQLDLNLPPKIFREGRHPQTFCSPSNNCVKLGLAAGLRNDGLGLAEGLQAMPASHNRATGWALATPPATCPVAVGEDVKCVNFASSDPIQDVSHL